MAQRLERSPRGWTHPLRAEHRVTVRADRTYGSGAGIAVRNAEGQATRSRVVDDITEGKVADALTGVPNRVLFMDRLGRLMEHSKRHPEFQVAVMFLDLDRFKIVNDSLGHDAGDALLVQAAQRVEGSLRSGDTVARLGASNARDAAVAGTTVARMGGDEFGVLLGGIDQGASPESCREHSQRVLSPVQNCGRRNLCLAEHRRCSQWRRRNVKGRILLRGADTAMVPRKESGPSRTELFSAGMRKDARVRLQTTTDLRRALDRNESELQYQPIVSLESERVGARGISAGGTRPWYGRTPRVHRRSGRNRLIVPRVWGPSAGLRDLRPGMPSIPPWPTSGLLESGRAPLAIPDLAAQVGAIVADAGVVQTRLSSRSPKAT